MSDNVALGSTAFGMGFLLNMFYPVPGMPVLLTGIFFFYGLALIFFSVAGIRFVKDTFSD